MESAPPLHATLGLGEAIRSSLQVRARLLWQVILILLALRVGWELMKVPMQPEDPQTPSPHISPIREARAW